MSKKTMTSVKFKGTKEQEAKLREIIQGYKNTQGALIPVLHEAQGIYGYLPIEVQQIISEELDIPMAEIYGVATFYTQFSLNPKGEYNISICMGTACYVKGAGAVLEAVEEALGIPPGGCTEDGRFSFEATRCLGCCGLAPVLTINDDVYGRLTKDDIKGIIDKYR